MANRICPPDPPWKANTFHKFLPGSTKKKQEKYERSFVDNCNHIFKPYSTFCRRSLIRQRKKWVMGETKVKPLDSFINRKLLFWVLFYSSITSDPPLFSHKMLYVRWMKGCTITACRSPFILIDMWLQWNCLTCQVWWVWYLFADCRNSAAS